MSLEIIGVVLGVIPLVIKAYSHSFSTLKTLTARHGFPSELKKLRSRLSSQMVIFRYNAAMLQSAFTNQEKETILAQWGDDERVDPGSGVFDIEERYEDRADILDQHLQSCKDTLERIMEIANSISIKIGNFPTDEWQDVSLVQFHLLLIRFIFHDQLHYISPTHRRKIPIKLLYSVFTVEFPSPE